jgi:predicted CopG family antitoxin|tara:strand:- start:389 stop:595 length:207 start_codon:yes stop_codon:yes gene_type:complete
MEMSTIAVPKKVKEQIKEFGMMGENYSEVIVRLIAVAKERQLHDLLMDETGCVPIEEALARAREKWPE